MKWVPLSKTAHAKKALKKRENVDFAKTITLVQLHNFEIQQAASYMPIMFVKNGDIVDMCGVLGLRKNENLFITEDNRWGLYYFPASFMSYPFRSAKTDDGKTALLFLEESGLIVDEDLGEPLFDEDGQETAILGHYIQLLSKIEQSNAANSIAISLMEKLELFTPSKLKVSEKSGEDHFIDGLLSIDLERLNELDNENFIQLRQTRAIELIYAHLFSLSSFDKLLRRKNHKDRLGESLKDLGTRIFEEKDEGLTFNF
jgi:hypothetical protein